MSPESHEEVSQQVGLPAEDPRLLDETVGGVGHLEKRLPLTRIDRERVGDLVRDVDGRRAVHLFRQRAIAARVVGDGNDRDEIRAERLDRFGDVSRGRIPLDLVEKPDSSHEVRLGVVDHPFHGEASFAARDDVGTAVR